MATIPHVVPDTLIESAAQNAFIDEVNNVCAKRTGSTMTGTLLFTNSAPAINMRRTGDNPYLQFSTVAGAQLAYIRSQAAGLEFETEAGTFDFRINSVLKAQITNAGGLALDGSVTTLGVVAARADDTPQIWVVDSAGSGVTGHAFIVFHPSGSGSATGTRGGYVGFNGDGMQVEADIGDLTLQSTQGDVTIETGAGGTVDIVATTATQIRGGTVFLVGKTTTDDADVGTQIGQNGAGTATLRNSIRNTVGVAGATNVNLRHVGASSADTQPFITFVNAAGTVLGSITQQGSGIRINNDVLVTELQERINSLETRLATLEAKT